MYDVTGFGGRAKHQTKAIFCFKLEVFMETVRDIYIYYVHLIKSFHNF